MGCYCRILILIVAVCCWVSRGTAIRCIPSCNVDEALDCQVKHRGAMCKSTALASSTEWPGEPKDLSLNQFIPVDHQDEVGFNVSWRMPNDKSALAITGFEMTLYPIGDQLGGFSYCYVFSLNTSQIELYQLVRTVFSMECYISNQAEGVEAVLYGLPRPQADLTGKQVTTYIYFTVPPTTSTDPCSNDPGISATMTDDVVSQLVVTLRTYENNSQYKIMLVEGTYERASQIIQPDKQAGGWKAVFEDPNLLRTGQCFYIRAFLTTCDPSSGVWIVPNETFCVNTTTTTISTRLTDGVKPSGTERLAGKPEEVISTSTIVIISAFGVFGIILLGVVAVFFIRKRSCTNQTVHTRFNNEGLNNEGVDNECPPPQEQKEVKQLVVVYDIGNCKSVRRFIEYLKKICPDLHIYDFVDVDAVEEDFGGWFLKVSGKAVSDGGRLLIIYSDGLMKLMEAASKQMCHPGYGEKVHSGEHMSSFLSLMQNRLFFRNNPQVCEWVISLGEDFHPDFHHVLVHFSGVKLNLFEWCNKQLSIHKKSTTEFLKMLRVNDVDEALADPLLTEVLTKTQEVLTNQTDPDWFINLYGNPELIPARDEDDPTTDSSSLDSSSMGSSSDEESINFSMKELPNGVDMSSERCPDNLEVIPPEFLHEDDSPV